MFNAIKKLFSKKISHDEKMIFEKVSLMLPAELKPIFNKQVDAIIESKPGPDDETLIYKIDESRLATGEEFLLTQEKGLVEFVKIEVRLFDQTQPFLISVKDGRLYSLRLFSPVVEQSDLPEFSVVKFNLLMP